MLEWVTIKRFTSRLKRSKDNIEKWITRSSNIDFKFKDDVDFHFNTIYSFLIKLFRG